MRQTERIGDRCAIEPAAAEAYDSRSATGTLPELEAAAQAMLARHRENDALPVEPDLAAKARRRVERLKGDAAQLRDSIKRNPEERKGARGSVRTSNRADNESAKMATSKGVIQGYAGVAAVDDRVTRSSSGLKPTAPAPNRNCCCRSSKPLRPSAPTRP